jgi:hypothetical protein
MAASNQNFVWEVAVLYIWGILALSQFYIFLSPVETLET